MSKSKKLGTNISTHKNKKVKESRSQESRNQENNILGHKKSGDQENENSRNGEIKKPRISETEKNRENTYSRKRHLGI